MKISVEILSVSDPILSDDQSMTTTNATAQFTFGEDVQEPIVIPVVNVQSADDIVGAVANRTITELRKYQGGTIQI